MDINEDFISDNSDISCEYYDVNQFKANFASRTDNLIIVNQNIRSYNKKSDELILFLNCLDANVDVLILTETWFSADTVQCLDGFQGHHCFRNDRIGGGVSIYVNKKYKSLSLIHI